MKDNPPWFRSLAWLETVCQLPFFFVGERVDFTTTSLW